MLLVEATIGGTLYYISDGTYHLTHQWKEFVGKFDPPQYALKSDHGGLAKFRYGSIQFDPDLFESTSNFPPPVEISLTIYHSSTTEEAKVQVFTGTGYIREFGIGIVIYDLHGPDDYDETVADSTAYNDDLETVIDTILTAIAEISTVDTTYARASSPNVTYTTSGENLSIDLASNIAEFYTHCIEVVGSTAYLIDMLLNRGIQSFTEFQYFEFAKYWYKVPVAEAKAGDYSRYSSYAYGNVLSVTPYHTTEANINTALDNIITVENSPRMTIGIPFELGIFPDLGQKVSFADTAVESDLSSWFRQRRLRYDLLAKVPTLWLEGEGEIASG